MTQSDNSERDFILLARESEEEILQSVKELVKEELPRTLNLAADEIAHAIVERLKLMDREGTDAAVFFPTWANNFIPHDFGEAATRAVCAPPSDHSRTPAEKN